MLTVDMLEAQTNLFKLVEAIESGSETEIIIARNGRPAAKLVAIVDEQPEKKIGVAKGKFVVPDNIDADNQVVENLFLGESL